MTKLKARARSFAIAIAVGVLGGADAAAQTISPALQVAMANTRPTAGALGSPLAQPVINAADDVLPPAAGDGVRTFRGRPEDDLLREMATRPVRRVIERFNSSTLVFHCDLGDGYEIAFKPARRGERDWWVHEIAGYELARAMGIDGRVPPAVYRRVPIGALDGFLRDANLEVERDGTVEGAAIAWMPVLHHSNIQTPESRVEWNAWLDPRQEIPAANLTRATQIASLIVFDYLQANFDRWNSANVPQDENNDLVFRDNNRAWYMQNLRRTERGGLDGIRRIPASVLASVERTNGAVLSRRTVGVGFPVLNRNQVREYETRRVALLARVERAVREYGRDHVVIDDSAAPIAHLAPSTDAPDTAPTVASPVAAQGDDARPRHQGRHGAHDGHGHGHGHGHGDGDDHHHHHHHHHHD